MPEEQELESEEDKRRRMIRLAIGILDDNTSGYMMGFTTVDGDWFYEASTKTYGLGASRRVSLELEELTKRDINGGSDA